ncbi:uncharacterized protein LOC130448616 [Diorhabda sublineata]|uniref:uncharacterized protein LOC130448616 n=1 Tax=Diorhabda sublineata TaxID=1163346 RepID=UPI0024E187D0|nr:uncharacterized protein LOC130448616 [Diorhabda sublineata]
MSCRRTFLIFSSVFFQFCFFVSGYTVNNDNTNNNQINARGILTSLASNFMSRGFISTGGGTSQIVSLNLTNLFVLVLLKAVIFAAGTLGAGHWKGEYARSAVDDEKFLTDDEILMYLSYLTGSTGCLQNVACQQPLKAKKYSAAGDLLLKFSKLFSLTTDLEYDMVLQELEQASNVGLAGGSCDKFECATGT